MTDSTVSVFPKTHSLAPISFHISRNGVAPCGASCWAEMFSDTCHAAIAVSTSGAISGKKLRNLFRGNRQVMVGSDLPSRKTHVHRSPRWGIPDTNTGGSDETKHLHHVSDQQGTECGRYRDRLPPCAEATAMHLHEAQEVIVQQ